MSEKYRNNNNINKHNKSDNPFTSRCTAGSKNTHIIEM